MIFTFIGTTILTIFFLILLIPFVLHLLDEDGHAKYGALYSVKGPYYRVKYLLFILLLKIRKYRSKEKPKKLYDINVKNEYKLMEKAKILDEDDSIDSVYFYCTGSFTKTDSKTENMIDIIIRMARRKNRVNEFWMAIKRKNGPNLVQPNCPETSVNNCSRNSWNSLNGFSLKCNRPNEKWTIKYIGWLKEDTTDGAKVHVSLKLYFTAFSNIIDSHKDNSEELTSDSIAMERWNRKFFKNLKNFKERSQTHYEQWGGYTGHLAIGKDNNYQLLCGKGYRDHSFGIRNWSQYQRYGALFGYLENGGCFSLGSVCCRNTLSHIRYGYYITPFGDTRPITSHNFNLWETFLASPPKSKYTVEFIAGQKFKLEVKMLSESIFNMNKGKGLIIERFMDYQLNGVQGRGVNEFFASDAVPQYKEPTLISIDILNNNNNNSWEDNNSIINDNKYCISLENEECRNRILSGGKGCQLGDIIKLAKNYKEINVPNGFVVTTNSYEDFLQNNTDIMQSLTELDNLKESSIEAIHSLSREITSSFRNGEMPEKIKESINDQFNEDFGINWNTMGYAIRSSSSLEDSSMASSAGQMETYLNVKGLENIIDNIKNCWASQFSPTALSYRIRNGQTMFSVMGVVVMRMVPSNISGVLFTANPLTGDSTTMVLNASHGLGEAIVSGKCEPDQFEIEKSFDGKLKIHSKTVGSKKFRMHMDRDMNNIVEYEEESDNEFCLTDDKVLRLAEIGLLIERCYGEHCDIEWADYDGEIFILQTRPITNLDIETEIELIEEFDSAVSYEGECLTTSNIGEMMPKAITPLTLSIFPSAIDMNFQIVLLNYGLLNQKIYPRRFISTYSNHLFLNLHCISLMSGGRDLDMVFLAILGRMVEKPTKEDIIFFTGYNSIYRTIFLNLNKILVMRNSIKKTKEWEKKFQCGYKIQNRPTAKRQMKSIIDQIDDGYVCWFDTIQNSSNSALWTMVLMRLLASHYGWNNELYSNIAKLLSTCSNVISADVPTALKNIASCIGKDKDLKEFVVNSDEEKCLTWFQSSKSKEAGILFQEFISRHGHRCIREAEFSELPWRQSPEKVVSVIKAMVNHWREESNKKQEEVSVDDAINNLNLNFNFIKIKIIKWVLGKARKGVSLREWGKSIAIQMCDAFRQAFQQLGELMVKEHIIQEAELVYYFTLDELMSVVLTQDESIANILNRVQRRRRIFPSQMQLVMPEICFGSPYKTFMMESEVNRNIEGHIKLSGLPVSVGKVRGPCRVISSLKEAAEIRPGEILIVSYTDIGWTPYFPLLGGLVTEKGSILSHGAVVAREFGLPCLVGCFGATKTFKTGDEVVLNGSTGTIELVDL